MKYLKKNAFAAAASLVLASVAVAQDYPSGDIRVIVPYSAGGQTDQMARLMAAKMQERLDTTVIVENVPGAGSLQGAAEVARSDPDGLTVLLGSYGLISSQIFLPNSPFAPEDLSPVFLLGDTSLILLVDADSKAQTLEDFVTYAQENPGDLILGSSGIGSSPHIAAGLFAQAAGIKFLHVPYQGAAPARTDVIAGRADGMFDGLFPGVEFVASGDVRALGIAAEERSPVAPEIPTFRELGLDFEFSTFYGYFVPSDTPVEIQEELRTTLAELAATDEVRTVLEGNGLVMRDISREEFQAYLDHQFEAVTNLVEAGTLTTK